MNAVTVNPPANESTANSAARRSTIGLDGPTSRRRLPVGRSTAAVSTAGDRLWAISAPAIAAGTSARNHRWSAGAPSHRPRATAGSAAQSAPTVPAAAATALYSENPRITSRRARSVASIACSSDVKGPDSTTSVDSAPTSATIARIHHCRAKANTMPVAANATYRPA
jgi:hypothetical protein